MKTTEEMIEVMQAHNEGKDVQVCYKKSVSWITTKTPFWAWADLDYRIKPLLTHVVNNREVPAPMTVKPEYEGKYWRVICVGAIQDEWSGHKTDTLMYEIGNCFKTEEDAQKNFNAIWKLDPNEGM